MGAVLAIDDLDVALAFKLMRLISGEAERHRLPDAVGGCGCHQRRYARNCFYWWCQIVCLADLVRDAHEPKTLPQESLASAFAIALVRRETQA